MSLLAVTQDGRLYRKEDLNSLLLAEGFSFDSTEFQTMAKIAVLFAYFSNPPVPPDTSTHTIRLDIPRNPCWLGAQGFPNIEFRSFTRQETEAPYFPGTYETRVTVASSINGVPETTTVVLSRVYGARKELDRLFATRRFCTFHTGRVTEPIPAKSSK
jgi:hypothetical protein